MNRTSTPSTDPEVNPKHILGSTKPPLHLWPYAALAGGSLALYDGALRYGRNNYNNTTTRYSTYIAAALRHITAYKDGQDITEDTHLHHIDAALADLAILRDVIASGNGIDDRNEMKVGIDEFNKYCEDRIKYLREYNAGNTPEDYTKDQCKETRGNDHEQ